MMNFCTLFDSYYLPKGLILYDSLCNVCDNFHLYVFAFDDECYLKLTELNLTKMTVISLKEFETKELLKIKPTRNRAEYCWTCGPSIIWHSIQRYNLDHCTYIDADLLFFNSPQIVYEEFQNANASVVITEHYMQKEDPAGRFCVQFVYFKNDNDGIAALKWWRDSCIEWCFAKYEDGRYGDQKYLESLPINFNNVYIIKNRGVGVAPWNMNQYEYLGNQTFSFHKQLYTTVFFHYHGVKVDIENNSLILKPLTYDITKDTEKTFFLPFLEYYKKICNLYMKYNIDCLKIEKRNNYEKLYSFIKHLLKNKKIVRYFYYKFCRRYNGYEKT